MAKKQNNLNISIFTVLKASEMSNVPVLLLSNPGVGKTSTVYMFAQVRGYEIVMLRGNSTSAEEIMGYDVAPRDVTWDKPMAACHLRPSWFEQILRNHAEGKKSLLFLDELTTANEFVQAALLHLIFERKCGAEKIPDDTLIVSAGNYFQNLTSTMNVLPPVMNRFCIFNVIPDTDGKTSNDLDIFLNKYEGAIVSEHGEPKNYMSELRKVLTEIDAQELKVDNAKRNKIGEYIERGIKDTTRMLITTAKSVDLTVTDLQDIYSDPVDGSADPKVYGFITFRILNYLRDVTMAYYLSFGKAGIASDNYRNAIDGLCGIGITRDKSSHDHQVKKTRVSKEYFDCMNTIVNDIEKMNNDKLPAYEKFFVDIVSQSFEVPQLNAINNKIKELQGDRDITNIERPIDSDLMKKLCKSVQESGEKICKISMGVSDRVLDRIKPEEFTNMVTKWNAIADVMSQITALTEDNSRGYDETVKEFVSGSIDALKGVGFKIRSLKKVILTEDSAMAKIIPDVRNISR